MPVMSDRWIRRMAQRARHDRALRRGAEARGRDQLRPLVATATTRASPTSSRSSPTSTRAVVDPKEFAPRQLRRPQDRSCIIPPNSFALGHTVEYFRIPRDVLVICLGKSTYARCGIIVNVTPLEPEWEGQVTIEISNTTPLPAQDLRQRGHLPVPVPARQRAVRDQLRRQGRQIHAPARRGAAEDSVAPKSEAMDRIRIRGGRPLAGEIVIGGAKNAALPLMAAGLLTDRAPGAVATCRGSPTSPP